MISVRVSFSTIPVPSQPKGHFSQNFGIHAQHCDLEWNCFVKAWTTTLLLLALLSAYIPAVTVFIADICCSPVGSVLEAQVCQKSWETNVDSLYFLFPWTQQCKKLHNLVCDVLSSWNKASPLSTSLLFRFCILVRILVLDGYTPWQSDWITAEWR